MKKVRLCRSARIFYREFVLMQAGWLPAVEHWQCKLTLPEYIWRDSLTAAALRERVLELRYPERRWSIWPGRQGSFVMEKINQRA